MLLVSLAVASALVQTSPLTPQAIGGAWSVDLSANADGSYLKAMNLTLGADKALTGDFYDSEILSGRWTAQAGRLCVAFRTTDGAGPYHTSACLVGDRIEGMTWAEHRNFVFIWTAVRPTGVSAP